MAERLREPNEIDKRRFAALMMRDTVSCRDRVMSIADMVTTLSEPLAREVLDFVAFLRERGSGRSGAT